MKIIKYPEDFAILKSKVFFNDTITDSELLDKVQDIIDSVIELGDTALIRYAKEFDGVSLNKGMLRYTIGDVEDGKFIPGFKEALAEAIRNIRSFHQEQLPNDQTYVGIYREKLSQRFTPMDSVGVYVPGGSAGKTPLVSTLLMNVIPAQIAGVEKIVVITPPSVDGKLNPYLEYALYTLGISEVYFSGGAQAIAALAYGTETVPEVDLIVGPGNKYVNAAKKNVFGKVMIDSLSGHSEIVIWAENSEQEEYQGHDPVSWIAADLLSQAEHAGEELVTLITSNKAFSEKVIKEVEKQTKTKSRRELIESSLSKRGLVVLVSNNEDAIKVINFIAPEHIEVLVPEAEKWVKSIKHAGAIFVGGYASEPIGDYICGTNHVLPTNRSARFSSPLGVYTFLKRTNIIEYNQSAFDAYAKSAEVLAEVEGLTAHRDALLIRKSRVDN